MGWLLISAAAGGLALALWLLRKKRKGNQKQGDRKRSSHQQNDPENVFPPETTMERSNRIIRQIVSKINFSSVMVARTVKIGEEKVPSPVPTGEIDIRPIRNTMELPRVLPSAAVMDDDTFYGALASRQLSVFEHQATVDITDTNYEEMRKVLVLALDVSPSMWDRRGGYDCDHRRLPWAHRLADTLLKRCITEKVQKVILFAFDNNPHDHHIGQSLDELESLRQQIPQIFRGWRGGTNIDAALNKAVELVIADGFDEAHIVLVTDGTEAIRMEETKRALVENKIHLHTVCIGVDHSGLKAVSSHYDLFVL